MGFKYCFFLGCLTTAWVSLGMHSQPSQRKSLKEIKPVSLYLSLVAVKNSDQTGIRKFFSASTGFFGSDCDPFNVAVKLIIDRDCRLCFEELLKVYDASDAFLSCRSQANGKTILHYLFEYIDRDNFAQFFNYIHIVISMHSTLIKIGDDKNQLPRVPENTLSPFELEMLNNLMVNHHKMNIVPKSIFLVSLVNKEFKKIQNVLKTYNLKKDMFLCDDIENNMQQTMAHFIVSLMEQGNFIMYYDILSALISYYPFLARQKDVFYLAPLDYLNGKLLEDQRLTQDKIKLLEKLLSQDNETTFEKKLSHLFSFFKK